jgi:glycosyltransferase involved in cell wall biosynthesis
MSELNHQGFPLVSVVIPVYNGQATIIKTLESVLAQTYIHFEIIIVDDGSDIPVESILHQIKDNRIRVHRTERSNANIARNYGISKSKGEYIALLDADDCWLENHLRDCLKLLQESKADGLYGSLFLSHTPPGDIVDLPVFHAREPHEGESMIDYLLTAGYGAQTSTLFTTAPSMKEIVWDPALIDHQDYDFVVRFCKKYTFAVKKEPSVIYFLSSGRETHYETCIRFVERNREDVDPSVYTHYNMNMYLHAVRKEAPEQFISYFRKETIRYKEYLSYQQYISLCDPQTAWQILRDKWIYLFYIMRIKMEV